MNITSKIIERIVHGQLYTYLETNNLLTSRQFGLRKGRCTKQAIVYLTDIIRKNMDNGRYTGAVYIDLRKAFDTVDHATLLSKLPKYGIKGLEHDWFVDYLFGRQQLVQFIDNLSEKEFVSAGVPQGSILGPLLFLLHVNDIVYSLNKSEMLLYADDMVLFLGDKNTDSVNEVLSAEFQNVLNWLRENDLIVNLKPGKTESILFGTSQKLKKVENLVVIGNCTKINTVSKY